MSKFAPKSIKVGPRYWRLGITSMINWAKQPISEEGAKNVARMAVALQGQRLLEDMETLRTHPQGQKLLAEKPDLALAIRSEALKKMPPGSFGAAYYKMNCQEDTLPMFMVGGLAYRDGFFDALDIDEDMQWYINRRLMEHDATHIISGYGTDLAGEGLNILFNLGHTGDATRAGRFMNVPGAVALLKSKTSIGFSAWKAELTRAYDRGAKARAHLPAACIPYEALLPLPLEKARARLGVEPLPTDYDTTHWCTDDPYIDQGEEKAEYLKQVGSLVDKAVGNGLDWRDYMRADEAERERVHQLLREETPLDTVANALREQQAA